MSQYITLEMGGRYPCYWNRGSNTTLVSEYGTSITAIVDVNIHRFILLQNVRILYTTSVKHCISKYITCSNMMLNRRKSLLKLTKLGTHGRDCLSWKWCIDVWHKFIYVCIKNEHHNWKWIRLALSATTFILCIYYKCTITQYSNMC